jgi:hypothetical protein
MSRMLLPTFPILYLPHIICLGLLLAANKEPKWYMFMAAGMAAGFSMHGYLPGRGVFMLFLGWFIVMFVTRKKLFVKPVNFLVFWGGFVIVASPMIYFALAHPDQYWSYAASVNPNRNAQLKGYIDLIKGRIPDYAAIFNVKTSWETLFHLPYKPLLDQVAGALFPAGLFMCAFAFWKPVPSVLLILFCGSMVPGLLGGGSSQQPNTQRVLMAFPIVFTLWAYFFERVKRVYQASGMKLLHVFLIAAGVIGSLWSFQNGIKEYFVNFANSPAVKVKGFHFLYSMNQTIKKHPAADIYLTPFYVGNDAYVFFLPLGLQQTALQYPDEMLVLNPKHDSLLFLGPFFANAADAFKEFYPNAVTDVVREKKEAEKDPFYSTMYIPQELGRHTDLYAPFLYSVSVFVPRQEIMDSQTMLVNTAGGGNERVKVYGGSNFAEEYSGKRVSLRGAVLVPEESLRENSVLPLFFNIGWKGWKLLCDGREHAFGRPLPADGGIHFFEISGIIPHGFKGDLPLTVMRESLDLVKEGRVVAVNGVFGARIFGTPGANNWDKPYTYSHRMITANMRFYDGMSMPIPFSLKEETMLTVPVTGEYEITANERNKFLVKVNGTVVYDDFKDYIGHKTMIKLIAGKPARLEVLQAIEGVPVPNRALTLYFKGPGMTEKIMAPYEWFSPVD